MHSNDSYLPPRWSNRVLLLAVFGILFLTLYPLRFDFHRHLARPLFPFSLGGWGKDAGPLDAFLNVLLFVPYGFGLAEKFRERGKSRLATVGLVLAAGVLLSYAIELLQIYIPQRDSGWEDIVTNSFGVVIGAMLYDLFGDAVFRLLSATERTAGAWLTWQRCTLALLLYVGCWCAIAAQLQKESRLSTLNPDTLLVVGNSASNRLSTAWKGRVFALEMWDHAVSPEFGRRITSREQTDSFDPNSIVAYKFSGSAPFQDERHLLPELSWTPEAPVSAGPNGASLDGKFWLSTSGAASALVTDLKKTGQFSLRVLCEPADISRLDARIVSISSPAGTANIELWQEKAGLAFWFRTPLSMQHARMSWVVPETFAVNEMRDILLSFDGANLSLFIDGNRHSGTYELGTGAALARFVRHIKSAELEGYQYIFYVIVFFPVGCLIGFVRRTMPRHWIARLSPMLCWLVLSSAMLEFVLVHVSRRAMSFENILLSIFVAAVGGIWINADCVR